MPITIRDLIQDGVTVEVRCTGCGKAWIFQGRVGLEHLGIKSLRISELQRRLRCRNCRHRGELVLTLPQYTIDEQRKTPRPISPGARVGPKLWRLT